MRIFYAALVGNVGKLFISIVASAVCDVETAVFHVINEAIFFVDPAAVLALQVAGQRFWLSDTIHY